MKKESRVSVRVLPPWCNDTIVECPVIDGQYVPISYLSSMMEYKTQTLMNSWGPDNIVHKIPNGGTNRNFVLINNLPTLLAKEGWDHKKIEEAMRTFQERHVACAPPRKRKSEDGDEEDDDVVEVDAPLPKQKEEEQDDDAEPYLKKGRTKRVFVKEKEPMPEWAREFMERVEQTIGAQAVLRFVETPEYTTMCEEAVRNRVGELEPEIVKRLEPVVTARLENELRVPVMQKLEEQRRAALMEPFKIRFTQTPSSEKLLNTIFGSKQN